MEVEATPCETSRAQRRFRSAILSRLSGASDIDYYYASRLRVEPAEGVNGIHFHPVEPRRAGVTLTASF